VTGVQTCALPIYWSARERARLETEMDALLHDALLARFRTEVPGERFQRVLDQVHARSLSPRDAVQQLVNGRKS